MPKRFVRACAASDGLILLALGLSGVLRAQTPAPLLVLLEGEVRTWEQTVKSAGWHFLAPWTDASPKSIDLRLKELETKLAEARKGMAVDDTRVYLAGQGDGGSALFYVVTRVPDLFTAAVAVGGTPRPAIDSNRLFTANTTNLPVLWLYAGKEDEALARKLKAGGFNLESRLDAMPNTRQVFEWLAARHRDRFPAKIDCETGTQAFPRCYWIAMSKFDAAERNDALDSTRIPPIGSGASLDLGGFGFSAAEPGPGVLVSWLPPGYRGPLRLKDRILSVGGKDVADAAAYVRMMEQTTEEREAAVIVARGKERVRLETRIVVPKRQENVTARVQGEYLMAEHQIQILSRAVAAMRVTVPPEWAPAAINWNGVEVGKAETGGCWLLAVENALLTGKPCP